MKTINYLPLLLGLMFLVTACQVGGEDQPQDPILNTATPGVDIPPPEEPTMEGELSITETQAATTPESTATATLSPTPTSTPTETPTETPVETPTLETIPTETIAATPDPQEGVGGLRYEDNFDGSSGWGWTYVEEDVVSFRGGADGVLAAFEDSDRGWRISLGPDTLRVGNQQVQLSASAEVCGDQDEWGLLFRGAFTEDFQFNGYVFKLNCAGQVRVERLDENQSSVLLGWLPVDGVETGPGSENTIMVWAGDEELRFYVNGTYAGTVTDSTYDSGGYGIFAQDRTHGNAQFLFQNLRVFVLNLE